jgi:hypothetical protein
MLWDFKPSLHGDPIEAFFGGLHFLACNMMTRKDEKS